jgi:hypothetical protein
MRSDVMVTFSPFFAWENRDRPKKLIHSFLKHYSSMLFRDLPCLQFNECLLREFDAAKDWFR